MSRIGKKPITIPEKVDVKINGEMVEVKGPKGHLTYSFHKDVKVEKADKQINLKPANSTTQAKAKWGMSRTILNNMVTGVTTGFMKTLEFNGVGYKAAVSGNTLTLNLGTLMRLITSFLKALKLRLTRIPLSSTAVIKNWLAL